MTREARKLRVYVAGKLSGATTDYISNMHEMLKASALLRRDFALFIPCIDILLGIFDGRMKREDYTEASLVWLEAADAVYVSKGGWVDGRYDPEAYKTSKGVMEEIAHAEELGIPVFYDIVSLKEWQREKEHEMGINT